MQPLYIAALAAFAAVTFALFIGAALRRRRLARLARPSREDDLRDVVTSLPRCRAGDCHVTVASGGAAVWLPRGAYAVPGEEIRFSRDRLLRDH